MVGRRSLEAPSPGALETVELFSTHSLELPPRLNELRVDTALLLQLRPEEPPKQATKDSGAAAASKGRAGLTVEDRGGSFDRPAHVTRRGAHSSVIVGRASIPPASSLATTSRVARRSAARLNLRAPARPLQKGSKAATELPAEEAFGGIPQARILDVEGEQPLGVDARDHPRTV